MTESASPSQLLGHAMVGADAMDWLTPPPRMSSDGNFFIKPGPDEALKQILLAASGSSFLRQEPQVHQSLVAAPLHGQAASALAECSSVAGFAVGCSAAPCGWTACGLSNRGSCKSRVLVPWGHRAQLPEDAFEAALTARGVSHRLVGSRGAWAAKALGPVLDIL
eukprot:2675069-Amphidinium_carterae.1